MRVLAVSLAVWLGVPSFAVADEPVTEAPAPGDGIPRTEPDLWSLPAPSVGTGFAFSFGLDGLSSGWDEQLARIGRPEVIDVAGNVGLRAFVQFEGIELSLNANLLEASSSSDEPATGGLAGTVFGEIAYDAARSLLLNIGPSFAVGWMRSSFCAAGEPSPIGSDAPMFRRALASPNVDGACLSADALLVRPGLVLGVALPLFDVPDGNVGFFNLRPSYSFVARQSKYESEGFAPFNGPALPHPSLSVSIEVGLTFGGGTRVTGL
jgi:hypothetical protein